MTEHGDGKRQSPGEPLVAGQHLPDSRGQGFHLWNLGRPVELASRNGPRATRSFSPSSLRTRGGPQENECPGKQGSVRSFENLFAKLSSKRACRSAVRRKYTWSNPSIRCLETCATHISRSCAARLRVYLLDKSLEGTEKKTKCRHFKTPSCVTGSVVSKVAASAGRMSRTRSSTHLSIQTCGRLNTLGDVGERRRVFEVQSRCLIQWPAKRRSADNSSAATRPVH